MRSSYRAILLIILFAPALAFSQSNSHQLNELYKFVEQADSLSGKSIKTFYLDKFLADDHNYKETWRYAARDGRIYFFQVDYILDSSEFTEVYYLNRGNLVCSEEYEKVNYTSFEDELKWGGIYYFQSTTPRHVVTLGKKKEQFIRTDPGMAALTRFEKRFSELRRHIPMLPKGY